MSLVGPNLGMNYDYALGEFWKTGGDFNWKLIDMLFQLAVIDKDISAQPGSPTNGDRYIVGPAATGADWPTHDGEIAVFIESAWEFHIPKDGWQAFALDENMTYYFDSGSWTLLMNPSSSSEPITDLALTGATPMDLSLGRNFRTPGATGNVTLSFTNVPAGVKTEIAYTWVQDGVGGHTLNFPAGTQWSGGVAAVGSLGINARDEYLFSIDDAGVISGNVVGQAYA